MKPKHDVLFQQRLRLHFGEGAERFSDDLLDRLHAFWCDAELFGLGLMCFHCGSVEGVELEDSRTCYASSLKDPDPDPNAPVPYCRDCAQTHHAYWDGMWEDYYATQRG